MTIDLAGPTFVACAIVAAVLAIYGGDQWGRLGRETRGKTIGAAAILLYVIGAVVLLLSLRPPHA